eukprot:11766189-Ditylum_brightwellii.AAC.1
MLRVYNALDFHFSVTKPLNTKIPNSYILDQYSNPRNLDATKEIWSQYNGKADMLVAGDGTDSTM